MFYRGKYWGLEWLHDLSKVTASARPPTPALFQWHSFTHSSENTINQLTNYKALGNLCVLSPVNYYKTFGNHCQKPRHYSENRPQDLVGISKPTKGWVCFAPQSISIFIICLIIITKTTVYVSRALYIIFETTPDAGTIITDTSGMWKLMPRKFMTCTQGHKPGSRGPGLNPWQFWLSLFFITTLIYHRHMNHYTKYKK